MNVLDRALALARESVGLAAPNPRVGCIIERDGRIVGEGAHRYAERDHAEVVALREAGEAARGATAHVTLEPCSSEGRTGPCTRALIESGIARVVAALPDPDPRHRGRGLALLREAGIEVAWAEREQRERAFELNRHFACWRLTGRPLTTLKAASSLDGRTASAGGESRWITSEEARRSAHQLRRENAAILCGVETVLADDPRLTCRAADEPARQPRRFVLDPRLRTPERAQVLQPNEAGATVIVTHEAAPVDSDWPSRRRALEAAGAEVWQLRARGGGIDLPELLDRMGGELAINGLLVEGGGRTTGRILGAGLGDELVTYLAPLLLGDSPRGAFSGLVAEGLSDGRRLLDWRASSCGPDLELRARLDGGFDSPALFEELEGLAEGDG